MSGEAIRVEGLSQTVRRLKVFDASIPPAIKAINLEAAKVVLADAETRVPRRSGRLAGSLRAAGTLRAGVVRVGGSRIPYAGPIHFGWAKHNIAPNPFLYKALDSRRAEVFAAYETQLRALIGRTFGGA